MEFKAKTIPKNQCSDKEYRALKDRLSYSALKLYDQSRYRFYKQMILNEYTEKESTVATIIGDLVHTLLAEIPGEFDMKFRMSSITPVVGQMGELVDSLYKRTLKSVTKISDSERQVNEEFSVLFMDAVQEIKYDGGLVELKFKGKSVEKI